MGKILFFSIWFAFHPVHVTLTSLDYIPETNDFNVFVKMYFDDFILDCKLIEPGIQQEKFISGDPSSLEMMESYISERLVIKVNNKSISGKVQDLDISDNELKLNIKYLNEKKPKTITVKNLIMINLYADQSNFIIVKVADFEEGVKLTAELTEQTLKIN